MRCSSSSRRRRRWQGCKCITQRGSAAGALTQLQHRNPWQQAQARQRGDHPAPHSPRAVQYRPARSHVATCTAAPARQCRPSHSQARQRPRARGGLLHGLTVPPCDEQPAPHGQPTDAQRDDGEEIIRRPTARARCSTAPPAAMLPHAQQRQRVSAGHHAARPGSARARGGGVLHGLTDPCDEQPTPHGQPNDAQRDHSQSAQPRRGRVPQCQQGGAGAARGSEGKAQGHPEQREPPAPRAHAVHRRSSESATGHAPHARPGGSRRGVGASTRKGAPAPARAREATPGARSPCNCRRPCS